MTALDDAHHAAREAAQQAATAAADAAREAERMTRLVAERAREARRLDPRAPGTAERLAEFDARLEAAAAGRDEARKLAASARAGARAARFEFGELADPREQTGRLTDSIPVLLMPMRIETRFAGSELWVRVFPDEWAVDAFSERLSDVEVANAARYWARHWAAGGDEDGRRAAWRGLVGSHGSGRALWIVGRYQPQNPGDEPERTDPAEVILVVAAEEPLPDALRDAAAAYWEAVWRAGQDREALEQARADLEDDLSEEEVAAVDAQPPVNLDQLPAPGRTRADSPVSIAVLDLPAAADIDPTPLSWSQPARAQVLPDRLVLLGYVGDALVLEAVGRPIPEALHVGPDPAADPDDQIQIVDGELVVPDELQWMVDFDVAVENGMALRINLGDRTQGGFDRLLVLGLQVGGTPADGAERLQSLLLRHRHSRDGFALVPQGTPTNNTEEAGAGYDRADDADASFELLSGAGPVLTPQADPELRQDGEWLATCLGIDLTTLEGIPGAAGTDQVESRAMNTALWPATWGYFLDSMLHPVVDDATVDSVRRFYASYVSGRGLVPAIRIGRQPYGILPTTALSRLEWDKREERSFEPALAGLLRHVADDWEQLADGVPHVGAPGDPHQLLLDIVALHPASVEFHQRYAESVHDLFNRAHFGGFAAQLLAILTALGYFARGRALLGRLGYEGADPEILSKLFLGSQQRLRGPAIDDRPLSETDPVRDYTTDGRNYLEWLAGAARTSLETLRRQDGFVDDEPPNALLYLLLRHGVLLSWWDTGLRLKLDAGSIESPQLLAARREAPFVHVSERVQASESRWLSLYSADAQVTGDPGLDLREFIPTVLGQRPAGAGLQRVIDAIERLAGVPTARLERVFAEHLDCCAYRLDAWRLGFVHERLLGMREAGIEGGPVTGIHLGAYGWLEDVRPEPRELTPVEDLEGELAETFLDPDDPPLQRDSSNAGFVHAPSLNHAATAAILRGGYLADASESAPEALAVNLTSERVRLAVALLEGIRNGQSLSALLGYRFERGLHDRHGLAEVDQFVFALRKAFPLRADRIPETATGPGVPVEAVEASNVLDGLELVRHVNAMGERSYPFGLSGLPAASGPQATAIAAEVDRLLDVHDAIADLALAEGVHQAVLGNADRVASTLEAYSRAGFPPEPAVAETPRSGISLTHRVGLHLRPGLDPDTSPVPDVGMTPRAKAEPAVNELLADVLPLPDEVGARVSWVDPVSGAAELVVSQEDLGLQPVDLVHILRLEDSAALGELDERILRHVDAHVGLRPDVRPEIHYTERPPGMVSFFELGPLVAHLRSMIERTRPLRPSDVAPHNEVPAGADETLVAPRDRPDAVFADLQTLAGRFTAYETPLRALLDDPVTNRAALLAGIDTFLDDLVDLLADAGRFAAGGTGSGTPLASRSSIFTGVLDALAAVIARWEPALAQADELLERDADLPSSATDEERFALLALAERRVSSAVTSPQPATPDLYRDAVEDQRDAFEDKLDDMRAIAPAAATLHGLLAAVAALGPLAAFDAEGIDLAELEQRVLDLDAELLARAVSIREELERRDTAATDLLAAHDASASAQARVDAVIGATRALCGEDVVVVPQFELGAEQGDAWEAALSWSRSGQLTAHMPDRPYPVEDWLHGVARVRDAIRHVEQSSLLGGVVGRLELELTALQLPHANEPWLALELPAGFELTGDRLLYTAHYPGPFSKTAPQCALLLDEWTEVLPGAKETTGIAFHYDRPDSEPPQAMLLATPPRFRGAWRWDDLVATLHETLDLARSRAVEPAAVDTTAYAQLLPATVMAATLRQISIATDLSLNNRVWEFLETSDA